MNRKAYEIKNKKIKSMKSKKDMISIESIGIAAEQGEMCRKKALPINRQGKSHKRKTHLKN